MTQCPVCGEKVDSVSAGVKNGAYTSERCERCMNIASHGAVFANKYRRDRDREDYRQDILQADDPDFVKQYPDRAREMFDDDYLRKHG